MLELIQSLNYHIGNITTTTKEFFKERAKDTQELIGNTVLYISDSIHKKADCPDLPENYEAPKLLVINILTPELENRCVPFWTNEQTHVRKKNFSDNDIFNISTTISADKNSWIMIPVDGLKKEKIQFIEQRLSEKLKNRKVFYCTDSTDKKTAVLSKNIPTICNSDIEKIAIGKLSWEGLMAFRIKNDQNSSKKISCDYN